MGKLKRIKYTWSPIDSSHTFTESGSYYVYPKSGIVKNKKGKIMDKFYKEVVKMYIEKANTNCTYIGFYKHTYEWVD